MRVASRPAATLGDAAITVAGVPVAIHNLTLSTAGVGVDSASATLPASLGPNPVTLTGQGLMLNTDGSFSGSLIVSSQNIMLAGFNVQTTDIFLDGTGLSIDHLTLTPPPAFNLPPIDVLGVALHADGSISGTISIPGTLGFSIGGFAFSAPGVTLSQVGIGAGTLSVTLPAALGGTTLSGHNIFLNSDGTFSGAPTTGPATAASEPALAASKAPVVPGGTAILAAPSSNRPQSAGGLPCDRSRRPAGPHRRKLDLRPCSATPT